MIQPAASSANSSLLLGAAMPAGPAEMGGGSIDFAALLGVEGTAEQPAPVIDAATMLQMLAAARPATGKQSGKTLPDALPDEPALADGASGESDTAPEEATVPPALNEPLLAILNAVTGTPSLLPTPKAELANSDGSKGELPPRANAPALPSTANQIAVAMSAARTERAEAERRPTPTGPSAVQAPVASKAQPAPADAVISVPVAEVRATAPKQPDAAVPTAVMLSATATSPKALGAEAKPSLKGEHQAQPNTAPVDAEPAEPALLPLPVATTQATRPAEPLATASRDKAAARQDEAAGAGAGAPASPALATTVQVKADAQPPLAAELQPLITPRDSQAPAAPTAGAGGPAQPSPVAGHDFAGIVDRLIEARDAVVPQPVQTSVLTAEFGRVSLRFDHDDAGLRVAMNSADPDFARAVQAAQPVAAAQTADTNAGSQRQDAPGQQNASSGSSASHNNGHAGSQSQAQSSARNPQDGHESPSRAAGRAARAGTEQDDADPRGGDIYA